MAVRREMGGTSKGVDLQAHDGSGMHIAIVHGRWNQEIVSSLLNGTIEALVSQGVTRHSIDTYSVPGSYELPFATKSIICKYRDQGKRLDAVISIGVLIKGSTMHFEYICDTCSHALCQVGLETGVPVIFGVLTCLTEEQAKQRAGIGENSHNHGKDWGHAAIEMAKFQFNPSLIAKPTSSATLPSAT